MRPKRIATPPSHSTAAMAWPTTCAQTCVSRPPIAIISRKWKRCSAMASWRCREVILRFALGKEYEDLDAHDRAFDHVDAGCNLQRRSITHDRAAEIAEVDRIIQTHTRSR